jgi:hypothetical protein
MDDADLVQRAAQDFVERMGAYDAVQHLYESAVQAASINDTLSVEAWLDIARAALQLLRAGGGLM